MMFSCISDIIESPIDKYTSSGKVCVTRMEYFSIDTYWYTISGLLIFVNIYTHPHPHLYICKHTHKINIRTK